MIGVRSTLVGLVVVFVCSLPFVAYIVHIDRHVQRNLTSISKASSASPFVDGVKYRQVDLDSCDSMEVVVKTIPLIQVEGDYLRLRLLDIEEAVCEDWSK